MEEKSSSTLPRLFGGPSHPHTRHHHQHQHHPQHLWQGHLDEDDFDVEGHAQSGRFSEDSSSGSSSESTSTSTTTTSASTSTSTRRKPSWSETFSYLRSLNPFGYTPSSSYYSPHAYGAARSRSMSLPPYHRLPQRPPSTSSSSGAGGGASNSQRRQRLGGLPTLALSSIPRRYYKPKLLCILILATFLCLFYREHEGRGGDALFSGSFLDWVGADELQLQSGMSLLRGSVSIGKFKIVVDGGAALDRLEEGEEGVWVAGEDESKGTSFKIDANTNNNNNNNNNPPLYPEYFAYEDSLIQHHLPPPSSTQTQKRYIHYANHNYLLGFNNHLEEYLLNAHLAFLANRSFVAHEYTWNPNWEKEPFSEWNGRKIPSRVPESVVLGGWLGGAVRHYHRDAPSEEGEEENVDLTPVSRPYYDSVCPVSERVYVNAQEVMDADLSEYVKDPGVGEGQKVGQADGVMVLKAWVERLNRDDVRDAKCVEVKRESGHAFDFWLFGSPRLHSLWPSLIQSPVLQHWSFSPLIYEAFQRNVVQRGILGESVKKSVIDGLEEEEKERVVQGEKLEGRVVDGIEYDEFGYPVYPGGYAYPPIYYPPSPPSSSSSSNLNSDSNSLFTQRTLPVSPYPRTPSTPLPILALHLRRGDFIEHCVNLAEWGSEFMGFTSFGEFGRDGFVGPGVDADAAEDEDEDEDVDVDLGDVDTPLGRDDVSTGTGTVSIQLSSSPGIVVSSSSSSFRGHRFSDSDPRKVKNLESKKKLVIGKHCYPENDQIVKRVREVVRDWVGGRFVEFVKSYEVSLHALGGEAGSKDADEGEDGYERALDGWKEDTLRRLKAVYVMTNGDKVWAGQVGDALRQGLREWEFGVSVDVVVSLGADEEKGQTKEEKKTKRVLEWTVTEWPWDTQDEDEDGSGGGIVITTARDLELKREEKYVGQAVDMYIGQRAEVFIGNGYDSQRGDAEEEGRVGSCAEQVLVVRFIMRCFAEKLVIWIVYVTGSTPGRLELDEDEDGVLELKGLNAGHDGGGVGFNR
ncbi:hypothetical protein MD484_g4833, partial [Candolleomyces efflorescens]